jgi:DNA ligase-1
MKPSDLKTIVSFPVGVQAKLDGIRMLSTIRSDGSIYVRSRPGKPIDYADFITPDLKEFLMYFPAGTYLDGELYSHGVPFTKLSSIIKNKSKRTKKDEDLVNYYIYDVILPDNEVEYLERFQILFDAFEKYTEDHPEKTDANRKFFLLTFTLANDDDEIDQLHDILVEEKGYEGAVIRKLTGKDSYYKFGRGSNALKFKKFDDEEGLIIGVEEGQGTNEGLAVIVYIDPRGNRGTVNLGSHAKRKRWLEHPEEIINVPIEYNYFGLTEYGKPRFPVGKRLRDEDKAEKTGKITKIVEGKDYDSGKTHYIVTDEDGFKVTVRSDVSFKKNNKKVGDTIKFKYYGTDDDGVPKFPFLL